MKRTKNRQDQIEILNKFAWGEISLDAMHAQLSKIIGRPVRRNPMMRHFGVNGICADRTIRITRAHLENVLCKRRSKRMSDRDLVDWATMLMINDAYYWNWRDSILSEWISRFHLDLL